MVDGEEHTVTGIGNGPLDGFVKALAERKIDVRILDYAEHALTEGDDSLAASYIECEIGETGSSGAWASTARSPAPRSRRSSRP